jgi:hypothetical protein
MAISPLRASTNFAHPSQKPLVSSATGPPDARATRLRRDRIVGPRNPSIAGRNVRDVAIVKATAIAEAIDSGTQLPHGVAGEDDGVAVRRVQRTFARERGENVAQDLSRTGSVAREDVGMRRERRARHAQSALGASGEAPYHFGHTRPVGLHVLGGELPNDRHQPLA